MVEDLTTSNIGQWYSKVKRMSQMDPAKDEKVYVQELMDVPSQTQAELISDNFSEISHLYHPLKSEDIQIPSLENSKPVPLFEPYLVYEKIKKIRKKESTVCGDIPWKVIAELSVKNVLSPVKHIYNSSTLAGIWPKLWKHEFITPVHKVFPPVNTDDLRKISGTKNLSKIYEALLSDPLVSDMMPNIDPSQIGNEKGLSIQDYLVKMVNKILTILDTNNEEDIISASADGGPRSQVCASKTLRSTPIDTSRNFTAHVSAESPSNISPNPSEVISEVSEP